MAKHILKVTRTNGVFRLVFPRKLVMIKRWDDVEYVLADDRIPDQIVIKRFIDGKALKADH